MGAYDCDCINNLEYDRRERKAQLSKEGTTKGATSDLISRMETVEHLRRVLDATVPITDYDEGYVDGVEFGISTVSTMPTIQPQSTTGQLNDGARSTAQSTDLIDRQAAIDALDFEIVHMTAYCDGKNEGNPLAQYNKGLEDGKKAIEALPSAQPERAEGEWVLKDHQWECNKCGCRINMKNPLSYENEWSYFFCPHCGTKMTIAVQRF